MGSRYVLTTSLCVVLGLFVLSQLTIPVMAQQGVPQPSRGEKPPVPPPGAKNSPPPKTVIVPITRNEDIPGMVNEMYQNILQLQQQVKSLQEQVSTLQTGLQTQQAALQKLQTQFVNHHHVVEEPLIPHPFRGAMFTTMNCPGIGQPCSLNSSSPGGSTYGIALWPPGSSPPDTAPPEPTATNVNTSGPQD